MQFRTELILPPSTVKISLGQRFLTVGSCFAEVIGRRLSEHKLDTLVNPFGTIFNPISQFELIEAALAPEEQEELPLVQQNGNWYAYNFHSSFSAPTKQELQQQIDFALTLVREQIEKADTLIFTFGTAMVYELAESDRIVANCHKVPQSNFNKRLLLSEEIVSCFTEMFALVKLVNPKVRVLLTVSPVRHLKETLVGNSVSKSVLRVACHYLAEMLPDVEYFPAYELLMDDLRDYRFYKDDLLHPTEMAEQYVWQKFGEVYFDQKLQQFADEWSRIRQSLAHKPFQQDSEGHQYFLQALLKQLEQLGRTVNVKAEIDQVKQQLMPVRRNKSPKKAPRELVSLLESLAASDVMAEDDGTHRSPASRQHTEREATLAESFEWPDQEEEAQKEPEAEAPVVPVRERRPPAPARLPQPHPQQQPVATREEEPEAEPALQEQPAATAPAPVPQEPFVHTKKSKSKKRREKRRAKLLASRGLPTATAPQAGEAPRTEPIALAETNAEAAPVNPPENAHAQRPVKKARNARNKSDRKTAGVQPEPVPETDTLAPSTPQPEAAEPQTPASAPENRPPAGPDSTVAQVAPARKKPGRKPAAAVGALLSALAQAQAPEPAGKPARPVRPARVPRKAAAAPVTPEAASQVIPEVAAPVIPVPVPPTAPESARAKPKRPTARKPKPDAPELPFTPANAPENAQAPEPARDLMEPLAAQAEPQSGKPPKEVKPKKEPAAPRKGKAKKIVLKKTPGGKAGNA